MTLIFRALLVVVLAVAAVGCGDDTDTAPVASGRSSTPEAASPGDLPRATITAEFSCGPADGHWIYATAEVEATTEVVAELVVDGTARGSSEPTEAAPGRPVDLGWAPSIASEDTGTVRLLRTEDGAELASTEIPLRLPSGMLCG